MINQSFIRLVIFAILLIGFSNSSSQGYSSQGTPRKQKYVAQNGYKRPGHLSSRQRAPLPKKLTSINLLDRNGMSETLVGKDRLSTFENIDFLSAQPYQKVMRVFAKGKDGSVSSCITSYHPNGQIKQYLEATNNRAFGIYKEWHSNGQIKIEAHIIGGVADLNSHAEESWLFDKESRAWDEEGHLVALICYNKGELEGDSFYYHPNGTIWKSIPFVRNTPHGTQSIFLEDGTLLQTSIYLNGLKDGLSVRYWDPSKIAYQETYEKGLLINAHYFSLTGEEIATIKEGNGVRAIFGKSELQELQTYKNGVQDGIVQLFISNTQLIGYYHIKNGEKEGEEVCYYATSTQPKLSFHWKKGMLHGLAKTWYENGTLESQRELCENKKNGLLTAWYQNGAVMLVEEYDNDLLVKGDYYRKGERTLCSHVEKGKGTATLFDKDGTFSRKVSYFEGRPHEQ